MRGGSACHIALYGSIVESRRTNSVLCELGATPDGLIYHVKFGNVTSLFIA
jgi:hypothetical protein